MQNTTETGTIPLGPLFFHDDNTRNGNAIKKIYIKNKINVTKCHLKRKHSEEVLHDSVMFWQLNITHSCLSDQSHVFSKHFFGGEGASGIRVRRAAILKSS